MKLNFLPPKHIQYPPNVKWAWTEVQRSMLDVTPSGAMSLTYIWVHVTCSATCGMKGKWSELQWTKGMYAPGFPPANPSLLVAGKPLRLWTWTVTTCNMSCVAASTTIGRNPSQLTLKLLTSSNHHIHLICFVLVAHVKWVYNGLLGDQFSVTNSLQKCAQAAS